MHVRSIEGELSPSTDMDEDASRAAVIASASSWLFVWSRQVPREPRNNDDERTENTDCILYQRTRDFTLHRKQYILHITVSFSLHSGFGSGSATQSLLASSLASSPSRVYRCTRAPCVRPAASFTRIATTRLELTSRMTHCCDTFSNVQQTQCSASGSRIGDGQKHRPNK